MGVLEAGVCFERTIGEIALAPRVGILGRGVQQIHGQWGPFGPAFRTPLGAALFVSGQPRDRVGVRNPAREHARHQFQRDVHRIGRPPMDRRGIYGEFGSGPARKSGLFRKTDRAWTRDGCFRDRFRIAPRTTLSGSACFSLTHRHVSSTYTILAEPRGCSQTLRLLNLYFALSLGGAFELV
jgi:hypothetical protein